MIGQFNARGWLIFTKEYFKNILGFIVHFFHWLTPANFMLKLW